MSKIYGDDEELTPSDARLIKGMIDRGDKNEAIASYFGVNQRAISHIRSGKKFSDVDVAAAIELPPPGPYGVDPVYIQFYRTMTRVNQLWQETRLGEAKALMEKALSDPVFGRELNDVETAAVELMRDQFGLIKE
ncbi:hypothetical protein [Sphingomonas sanxanigenens]|uniref:hypothetical protein n=1 Tax=Sphingomonas sanxanigenens TaxID=397260 RepID=UPI0013016854|nr:hypothetical protein [Sphingomonas sanxanigenens]